MIAYRLIIIYCMLMAGTFACDRAKITPTPEPNYKAGLSDFNFIPVQGHVNTFVKITGTGFGDKQANVKVWFNKTAAVVKEVTDKYIITAVPANATTGKITITINDNTFTSSSDFTITAKDLTLLTGSWVRKADFPGIKRSGVTTFANAASGFVAVGANGDFTAKDTWQYQAATDQWMQRPDFPGIQRFGAISFSIDKKAYVVTGFAYFRPGKIKDFWEFDTETFVWTRKADFPGLERKNAAAFALNNKGYVTTGILDYFEPELHDVWEYDPAADKWRQKSDIPFATRKGAACFNIGDKIYLGLGTHVRGSSEEVLNDFWQYEPALDKWTRKADFPEYLSNAYAGFVLNKKGYLISGNQECWEYNPEVDKWMGKKPVPETTAGAASFVAGNNGYILMPYAGHLYQFEP